MNSHPLPSDHSRPAPRSRGSCSECPIIPSAVDVDPLGARCRQGRREDSHGQVFGSCSLFRGERGGLGGGGGGGLLAFPSCCFLLLGCARVCAETCRSLTLSVGQREVTVSKRREERGIDELAHLIVRVHKEVETPGVGRSVRESRGRLDELERHRWRVK